MALGTIQAIAIKAPNRLNSKSVTVATATPTETTNKAKTCTNMTLSEKTLREVTTLFKQREVEVEERDVSCIGTFLKEMVFLKSTNSEKTMVGVTAILAIW